MLAATRERADAEEENGGLQGAAETRRPVQASRSGHEVGLLHGFLHGPQVAEDEGNGRSCGDDGET